MPRLFLQCGPKVLSVRRQRGIITGTKCRVDVQFATYFLNFDKYRAILMTRAYVDLLLAEIALKNYTPTARLLLST
jgi:hypothetical protein